MSRLDLDPRTLRWVAREAVKSRDVMAFHEFDKGSNFAFGNIAIRCRERARAVERKQKPKGKRKP